jgi:hypothetical protein
MARILADLLRAIDRDDVQQTISLVQDGWGRRSTRRTSATARS